MTGHRRALALLSLTVLCSPAAAQTEDDPEHLAESAMEERVVVTATGNPTPADRLADTVSVVTAEQIERRQRRTVAEALLEVPGVDVRRTGGPGSVSTLFLRGSDSDHTLVLVDGIEMFDPSTPARQPFIDHLTTDEVERIEVLHGPMSPLYGSDAIGGVVQVVTRRGGGPARVDGWLEGGSFGTFRGGVTSSGGGDRFGYTFNASQTEIDGFSSRSGGAESDPYENTSLAGRFTFEGAGPFSADVVVRHIDAETEFDSFSESGNVIDASQTLMKIEPRLVLADGRWEQRLSLRGTRHRRDTRGDFPSRAEGEFATVEWRNDLRWIDGHTLSFGAEREREEGRLATFDDRTRTTGLFVQDQLEIGERFFGTVGLRSDDHSTFGSKTTWRAAAGVKLPGVGGTVRASWGTGFKAPSLSELNESAFAGNPSLEAETSRGIDVGFEQVGTRHRAGVTIFETRIEELIVAVFDPGSGSFLNFNVDDARARGAEVYATFAPTDRLDLRASYTYTGSEALGQPAGFGLSEGSSLLRRPRNKASVDVAWTVPSRSATLSAGALYVGRRNDVDPSTFSTVDAEDWLRVDLRTSWRLAARLQLLARVENLFDEEYEDVLGFQTAERSGYVGLRTAF